MIDRFRRRICRSGNKNSGFVGKTEHRFDRVLPDAAPRRSTPGRDQRNGARRAASLVVAGLTDGTGRFNLEQGLVGVTDALSANISRVNDVAASSTDIV